MTNKIWAWHPAGVVTETVSLPSDWVPGVDIYTPAHAFDMTDVTALSPQPAPGWTTADGGATFVAPPPATPPKSTRLGFLAFMALFTATEQSAIVSSTNAQVRLFCLMAAGATFVDLTDARVVTGVDELETLGLIGTGRAAQVLAAQAPSA